MAYNSNDNVTINLIQGPIYWNATNSLPGDSNNTLDIIGYNGKFVNILLGGTPNLLHRFTWLMFF